jgi:hypothetical protein
MTECARFLFLFLAFLFLRSRAQASPLHEDRTVPKRKMLKPLRIRASRIPPPYQMIKAALHRTQTKTEIDR